MSSYLSCVFPLFRTYETNIAPVYLGTCIRVFNEETYLTAAHCLRTSNGEYLSAAQLSIGHNPSAAGDQKMHRQFGIKDRSPGDVRGRVIHPNADDHGGDVADIAVISTGPCTGGMESNSSGTYFDGIAQTSSANHVLHVGTNIEAYFYTEFREEVNSQGRIGTTVGSDDFTSMFPRLHSDLSIVRGNSGGAVRITDSACNKVSAMLLSVESIQTDDAPSRLDTSYALLLDRFETWIKEQMTDR